MRDNLVHQAHIAGFLRAVFFAAEPDLACLLFTNVAGKQCGAPAGIGRAYFRADLAENRFFRGDSQVAESGEYVAATDCEPLNLGNRYLTQIANSGLKLLNWQAYGTARAVETIFREMRFLVAASTECLVASARKHNGVDRLFLIGALECNNQLFHGLQAKGIKHFRTVYGNTNSIFAKFVKDVFEFVAHGYLQLKNKWDGISHALSVRRTR